MEVRGLERKRERLREELRLVFMVLERERERLVVMGWERERD